MKLPKFIFDKVKEHKTSLGNNEAFPPEEDYPFDYKLLKDRFNEVTDNLHKVGGIGNFEVDYLTNLLSSLITECQKEEEKIKNQLEKLCRLFVMKMFCVPDETIDLECTLVTHVKPSNKVRVVPEESSARNFDFEDLSEFDSVNKVILKRRFINSLIQGVSYDVMAEFLSSYETNALSKHIFNLNPNLLQLYRQIIAINDYLLFVKEDKITDDNMMQGSYVEVLLGRENEQTEIKSQAILFPFLLSETVRGLFELFASHSLPDDNRKAKYILSQADFLVAEPWDLRLGVKLWQKLKLDGMSLGVLPYYFMYICDYQTDAFNENMREALAHTTMGQKFLEDVYTASEDDYKGLSLFPQKNDALNVNTNTIISDSYISLDELDDEIIEEEEVEDDHFTPNNFEEVTDIPTVQSLFDKATEDDVNFCELPVYLGNFLQPNICKLQVVLFDSYIIPTTYVNFMIEVTSLYGEQKLQPHIFLKSSLQRRGITTKVYRACAREFGELTSQYCKRAAYLHKSMEQNGVYKKDGSDDNINRVWGKLSTANHPNYKVKEIYDEFGNPIGNSLSYEK